MSDTKKTMPQVGRRDTLKLATAVTALGAGLGVVLDAGEAAAAGDGSVRQLRTNDVGNLTVKLYKLDADGKTNTLLETVDVGALSLKMSKVGSYSLKIYNLKLDAAPTMLSEQALTIASAPAVIKR